MDTVKFLRAFPHAKYTLAHFFAPSKMRSFPCTPENLDKALQLLHKQNKEGAEIYFTPNEGNGVYNASKTACHSSENVINLSAIFIDAELKDESDPLQNILAFCNDYFVAPSIVVNTSKNRYHIYFLLTPTYPTKDNVLKWKQIQAFLNTKLSIDRTMTDTPQLLRLPGFKNVKKDFDVTVTRYNDSTWSLSDLYNTLYAQFPEVREYKPHQPLQPTHDDYKVAEGERHEELLRRARKMYAMDGVTDSDVKCYIDGFIRNHVAENVDFLPTGQRYEEVERILAAAKGYADSERIKQASEQIAKHVERVEKRKSPFELDPEFFYNAPGLVGELTRHIVDIADYPIPAHAFAAAVSITGFCKARYIQGSRKLPPLNYFLCLAPSGAGKTTINNTLKECFTKLQINQYLEDGIASAQGLLQFLGNCSSLGLILYDEVKDLFQTIQNKRAATYEVKIATELTKLYTAYASFYTPPTTKTHKGKKVNLNNPLFSFLGYGHFTLIESLFTKANVSEGLLPRFLIFNVNTRKKANGIYKPIPSRIIDELRYHVTKSCLYLESENTKQAATDQAINTDPVLEIKDLSADAVPLYNAFEDSTTVLYNQAVAERTGLEALFSRGCEQALRLSLAMAPNGHIDAKTLSYTIELVNSQMQQFNEQFDQVINQTTYAKETNWLYDKMLELCADAPDYAITKQQLRLKVRYKYEAGAFEKQLQELIEQGRVREQSVKNSAGRHTTKLSIECNVK